MSKKKTGEKNAEMKKDTLERLAEVMERSKVLENIEMILDRLRICLREVEAAR